MVRGVAQRWYLTIYGVPLTWANHTVPPIAHLALVLPEAVHRMSEAG